MLFIYVNLAGRVAAPSLRAIIGEARAYIAVVAMNNAQPDYLLALRERGAWTSNIVLTLDRRGDAFSHFFKELFARMFEGYSMLMAWVELAPKGHSEAHSLLPSTYMAAEAGHITFWTAN